MSTNKVNFVELKEVHYMRLNIGSFPNHAEEIVMTYLEEIEKITQKQVMITVEQGDDDFTVSFKYKPDLDLKSRKDFLRIIVSMYIELNSLLEYENRKIDPPQILKVILNSSSEQIQ